MHPTNPQIAYLGAAEGGVWKTSDGGTTWGPRFDNQPSLAIGSVAIDPVHPDVVYAGTGEANHSGDSYFGDGVFRSTDAGASWVRVGGSIFDSCFIAAIIVNPTKPSTVVLAADAAGGVSRPSFCPGGIYRSTNSGASWTRTLPQFSVTALTLDPNDPAVWYAGGGGAVFKSDDTARTWTQLGGGLPGFGGRVALAVAPSNSKRLYAALPFSGPFWLFTSNDAGTSWAPIETGESDCYQCWYNLTLAVDPTDAKTFYFGTGNLLRFHAAGSGFTYVPVGHVDQHALVFDTAKRLWIGNDGGAYRSDDHGATVIDLNATLAISEFYPGLGGSLATTLTGGTQDNGTAKYTGKPRWTSILGADGGYSAVNPRDPGILYATTQEGGIYKSTDAGANFNFATSGINSPFHCFIEALVPDPATPRRLYTGAGSQLYVTNNGAASWQRLHDFGQCPTAIAPAPGDPATLYVATAGRISVTRDGGTTWRLALEDFSQSFSDIAVSPGDAGNAFITNSAFGISHVLETKDYGHSWRGVSGDLPDTPANAVAVDVRTSPPTLYAGTDVGVFASTNEGVNWSRFGTDLPNTVVMDLVLDLPADQLVATTHGRGAFSLSLGHEPPMTVTRPNGGEMWALGSTHAITWTYRSTIQSSVRIDLLQNGVMASTITPATPIGTNGSGSFRWTLPANLNADSTYRVWVHSTLPPAADSSDGDFSLVFDFKPPTTHVASPSSGAALSGVTTLDATASDNVGVDHVEFRLFGDRLFDQLIGTATLTPLGWVLRWDTHLVPDGSYVLFSKAYDTNGNAAYSHGVSIRIQNGAAP